MAKPVAAVEKTVGETGLGDKIKIYLESVQFEIMLIRHLMEMSHRWQDMFLKSGGQEKCQGWKIYRLRSY